MTKYEIFRKAKTILFLLNSERIVDTVLVYDKKTAAPFFAYKNENGIMESEVALHCHKHVLRKNSKFKYRNESSRIFFEGRKITYSIKPI